MMTDILKKASRMKKKYFLDEEFFETVSKKGKYNPKAKLERRELTYKCSGVKVCWRVERRIQTRARSHAVG